MKLIVGLGNPGKEYENTRHNVGFMVVDNYVSSHSLTFKEKFNGMYAEVTYQNEKIVLLKPQSFMNLSGGVVSSYKNYFKISNDDILIIYDDISFNLGEFKLKKNGSSGGHNGMKDIIKAIGTEEIKRLKIGISKNNKNLKNYVLGKFGIIEKKKLKGILFTTSNIIDDYLKLDFEKLMCKYNGSDNEN